MGKMVGLEGPVGGGTSELHENSITAPAMPVLDPYQQQDGLSGPRLLSSRNLPSSPILVQPHPEKAPCHGLP